MRKSRRAGRGAAALAASALLALAAVAAACQQQHGREAAAGGARGASDGRVDPAARARLERAVAAYRALTSYAGTMEVREVAGTQGAPRLLRRASVVFQRPGRAAVSVATGGAGGATGERHAGDEGADSGSGGDAAIVAALEGAAGGPSALSRLLRGKDPVAAASAAGRLVSLETAGDGVVAVVAQADGEKTVAVSFGREDGLLRKVSVTGVAGGKPFERVETHADVRVNPVLPPAMFAAAPPAADPGHSHAATPAAAHAAHAAHAAAPAATAAAPAQATLGFAAPPPRPAGGGAAAQQQRHDAGELSLLDRTHVEHTFRLRNTSSAPLKLTRLSSTCGCTSSIVGEGGGSAAPSPAGGALPTLAPGAETSVRVALDLRPLPAGPLRKSVAVYAEGRGEPVATFEITGTLRPAASFSPRAVEFGRVAAGGKAALRVVRLEVTLDPRLTAAGAPPLPPLVASHPAVRVRPLPAGKGARVLAYELTLAPDAPLGPVAGSVAFQASASAAPTPLGTALRAAAVPVSGEVAGPVSATPQAVAFGLVAAGQTPARDVLLRAETADALAGASVAPSPGAAASGVTARLVPAPGGAGADARNARVLRVSLGTGAAAGALQSEVTLTLASGQRMTLPVTAYVTAPAETAKPR